MIHEPCDCLLCDTSAEADTDMQATVLLASMDPKVSVSHALHHRHVLLAQESGLFHELEALRAALWAFVEGWEDQAQPDNWMVDARVTVGQMRAACAALGPIGRRA